MGIFIYRPQSGDRVFEEKPGPNVRVTTWSNGCRHVDGPVAHFSFHAAHPGGWWRVRATDLVREILSLAGEGVGWDDRGEINVVVPHTEAGYTVRSIMDCIAGLGENINDPVNQRGPYSPYARLIKKSAAMGISRLTKGGFLPPDWSILPLPEYTWGPPPRYREEVPVQVCGGPPADEKDVHFE